MRLEPDQHIAIALAMLERIFNDAYRAAAPRSLELRLALAFLFTRSEGLRAPYDAFWREITREGGTGSWMTDGVTRQNLAEVHLAEIYRSVGVMRTPEHEAVGRPKSSGPNRPI